MPVWKLIHVLVRWATLVVAQEEGSARIRLPGLSQLSLGRLMSRSDSRTCMDIAMDILKNDPSRSNYTDEQMYQTMRDIREGFGEVPSSAKSGYRRDLDSLVVARRLLAAVERQLRTEHQRKTFAACIGTTTWAGAAQLLPGRDWQSVRDDFRSMSILLWSSEPIELSAAIDQMVRRLEEARAEKKRRA